MKQTLSLGTRVTHTQDHNSKGTIISLPEDNLGKYFGVQWDKWALTSVVLPENVTRIDSE